MSLAENHKNFSNIMGIILLQQKHRLELFQIGDSIFRIYPEGNAYCFLATIISGRATSNTKTILKIQNCIK